MIAGFSVLRAIFKAGYPFPDGYYIFLCFNRSQTGFFSQILFKHACVLSFVLITSNGHVGIEAKAPANPPQKK